jgi:hypothetical protein
LEIDEVAPDVNDFTTWALSTWGQVEFNKITFSQGPNVRICLISSYLAVAILMWYKPDLRLWLRAVHPRFRG